MGCDYDETVVLGYAPQEKDEADCVAYFDELFEMTQEVPKRSSVTLLTDNNGTINQEGEEQHGYEVEAWRVCGEGGEGHTTTNGIARLKTARKRGLTAVNTHFEWIHTHEALHQIVRLLRNHYFLPILVLFLVFELATLHFLS